MQPILSPSFKDPRGGNEFGKAWWKDGTKKKKIATVADVIATARWLKTIGWSQPECIALMGTSNGGFVTAAAGVKSPSDFGLIIPISGVYDQEHLAATDPVFGPGWMRDYGDGSKRGDNSFISRTAPVELAKAGQSTPKIFMVAGADDNRVSFQDSYRLSRTLLSNPRLDASKIHLATIKNAGQITVEP